MNLLNLTAAVHWTTGEIATRQGNRYSHFQLSANFDTIDNRQIHIVAVSVPHWRSLCNILNISKWGEQYLTMDSRHKNRNIIIETINTFTALFSSSDLLNRLRLEGIPAGLVSTLDEALNNPQMKARDQIKTFDYPGLCNTKYISLPFKMHGLDLPETSHSPLPGEHTDSVLRSMGKSDNDIANLKDKKVVYGA